MEDLEKDLAYMGSALALAQKAQSIDEVPVGALVVLDDEVIGEGWNQPISTHDPTAHAELIAIRQAANHIGNYRLLDTVMYVTLEPCCMCVGAMIHARIKRLVYAAPDLKTGAVSSAFNLLSAKSHNHAIEVSAGVLEVECSQILSDFFSQLRKKPRGC